MNDSPEQLPNPAAISQQGMIAPVSPAAEPDWDTLPEMLSTNEAADIIGVSAGNIRARASKGEFGNTQKAEGQKVYYSKEAVRSVYQKLAQNRNTAVLHGVAEKQPPRNDMVVSALNATVLSEIKEAKIREVALVSAQYADKAQEVERQVQQAETLTALLSQREEATREIISAIVAQCDARVGEIEAHRAETIAAQKSEIERLRQELEAAKQGIPKRRKLFGLFC